MAIPNAAPPLGPLRWASPQPAESWTEVRDGTQLPNRCAQNAVDAPSAPGSETEDCLYLNVTSHVSEKGPRPVLVWVHGGGFTGGSANDYPARRLAEEGDLVVVAINYRLGIFGFFGYPGLDGSGVFGLQDQIAALKWVRDNIADFGGDPENVTIAGESAGGESVCALLTSPLNAGLFHKVIIQSGTCMIRWPASVFFPGLGEVRPYVPVSSTLLEGLEIAAGIGCNDPGTALECLRNKPASDLLAHGGGGFISYGGSTLPLDPAIALRTSRFQAVPALVGGTQNEHSAFAGVADSIEAITAERYQQLLTTAFETQSPRVRSRYPISSFASPAAAWAQVGTDVAWACTTLQAAELLSERAPVYVYEFADAHAPNPGFAVSAGFSLNATHSSELAYLFDFSDLGDEFVLTPAQQKLSKHMIKYWAQFARTGDPNIIGSPVWSRFVSKSDHPFVLSLAPGGIGPVDFSAAHQCEFWSQVDG